MSILFLIVLSAACENKLQFLRGFKQHLDIKGSYLL